MWHTHTWRQVLNLGCWLVCRLARVPLQAFYSEISKNNKSMPFTLRQMVDEKNARLGVQECVKHEVVDAFKILWENDGEFVAQFKLLVLVLPKGNLRASAVRPPSLSPPLPIC